MLQNLDTKKLARQIVGVLTGVILMGLGTSPYDALPFVIHRYLDKFSFRAVRISYDLAFIVIGYVFGAPFAVVTIMMAFLLGPAIELVGEKIKPYIEG